MTPDELDEIANEWTGEQALAGYESTDVEAAAVRDIPRLITALRQAWAENEKLLENEGSLRVQGIARIIDEAGAMEREACVRIADDVMRAVHSGAEVAQEIRDRISERGPVVDAFEAGRAAEREECAKLAEACARAHRNAMTDTGLPVHAEREATCLVLVDLIRARGNIKIDG